MAVLMVIFEHSGPTTNAHSFGDDGVRLFFVLSGFLITGILLRLRGAPIRPALKAFYARRVLRILPPYYVLLAVMIGGNIGTTRRDAVAHLLYLSNWRFLVVPWVLPLNNLWSLSVEEQFYLVWPFVVLATPAKYMRRVFLGMIGLAVVARVAVLLAGGGWAASQVPTPISLDALGAGALLAWHLHTYPTREAARRVVADRCLLAGSLVLVGSLAVIALGARQPARMAIEAPAATLISVWLVERAARGFDGAVGRLLTARPVAYLGTVSYGIYLVQSPIRYAFGPEEARGWPLFVVVTLLSVGAASISWRYLERPINRRKALFQYPTRA